MLTTLPDSGISPVPSLASAQRRPEVGAVWSFNPLGAGFADASIGFEKTKAAAAKAPERAVEAAVLREIDPLHIA